MAPARGPAGFIEPCLPTLGHAVPTGRSGRRLVDFDVWSRNGRQARPVARVVGEHAHGAEIRAGVRGGRRVVCPVDLGVRRLSSPFYDWQRVRSTGRDNNKKGGLKWLKHLSSPWRKL